MYIVMINIFVLISGCIRRFDWKNVSNKSQRKDSLNKRGIWTSSYTTRDSTIVHFCNLKRYASMLIEMHTLNSMLIEIPRHIPLKDWYTLTINSHNLRCKSNKHLHFEKDFALSQIIICTSLDVDFL